MDLHSVAPAFYCLVKTHKLLSLVANVHLSASAIRTLLHHPVVNSQIDCACSYCNCFHLTPVVKVLGWCIIITLSKQNFSTKATTVFDKGIFTLLYWSIFSICFICSFRLAWQPVILWAKKVLILEAHAWWRPPSNPFRNKHCSWALLIDPLLHHLRSLFQPNLKFQNHPSTWFLPIVP